MSALIATACACAEDNNASCSQVGETERAQQVSKSRSKVTVASDAGASDGWTITVPFTDKALCVSQVRQ